MPKLRFAQFSGEIPKLIPRLLPDSASQFTENVRLDDGALTPIRKPRLEHVFVGESNIQTVYKHQGTWLSWDTVVNAVPGPVADDRLYYTGDGAPKMRIGTTVYDLALAYPSTKPTVTVTGSGTGDIITRLYVYTWVTSFGEESEPSPVSSSVTWQSGQTVTLSGFVSPPSGRGVTKMRIYRSQTSTASGTDLFLIQERNVGTSNYVDTHAGNDYAEVLPSRDYNQPPADLTGLIALPNGMMAGFSGKQLCFCEPYIPHAWPEKYRLTTPFDIVGIAAYGRTVIVGTTGFPFAVSGNSPDTMIEEKIEVNLPCINVRGMVDMGTSVVYPSNDGLVVADGSGAAVVTGNLFTRAGWQKFNPDTFISGQFNGQYFVSYSYLEPDGVTVVDGAFIIDLTGKEPFVKRASYKPDAFYFDPPTGQLYFVLGNEVYEYDAVGQSNEIMTWRSKRVVLSQPATFGALLIESGVLSSREAEQVRELQIEAIEASNAEYFAMRSIGSEINAAEMNLYALAGDPLQQVPADKWVSVKIFADDTLIKMASKLDAVSRIPPKMARVWEIQVNGTAEIDQITLATTTRELTEG